MTLIFTDAKGKQHHLAIDAVEDIFGFNSTHNDHGEDWYYWVSLKTGDVLKSMPFPSLDEAREEYSSLKLAFERGLTSAS